MDGAGLEEGRLCAGVGRPLGRIRRHGTVTEPGERGGRGTRLPEPPLMPQEQTLGVLDVITPLHADAPGEQAGVDLGGGPPHPPTDVRPPPPHRLPEVRLPHHRPREHAVHPEGATSTPPSSVVASAQRSVMGASVAGGSDIDADTRGRCGGRGPGAGLRLRDRAPPTPAGGAVESRTGLGLRTGSAACGSAGRDATTTTKPSSPWAVLSSVATSALALLTGLASRRRGLRVGSACCFLGCQNLIAVLEGPCANGVDGSQQGAAQSGELILDP